RSKCAASKTASASAASSSGVGLAPKTEFVLRADSHLAYQVFGRGNAKVLMLYGVPSHLDYFWEFPIQVRVHERLARLARVAVYDWRGFGMSDPLPKGGYPIMREQWARYERMSATPTAMVNAFDVHGSVDVQQTKCSNGRPGGLRARSRSFSPARGR